MADNSLNEIASLINHHIESQEILSELLGQAEALAHIALGDDFLEHPELIIHHYLWALSGLVGQARQLNEQLLGRLQKTIVPQ